ncbi:DUF2919 domain-containing protein [Vibrio gallicus]|uniref:DUF2919 domain-containing protein n=1 Tax=Vibrio gallicus TaxID=190897 RepID=UPI0021C3FF27|nr:DUF2919 domain-containing protein [Vibrio gallicus]
MRYFIEDYDKHGYLKAPIWLWVGLAFLARGWVAFVMAAATRDKGSEILGLLYPSVSHLYLMMWLGLPSIVIMWFIGLRTPERPWIAKVVRIGRWVVLATAFIQIVIELQAVVLRHGQFSWGSAVSIVGLSWIIIYLFNSHRVKECFKTP